MRLDFNLVIVDDDYDDVDNSTHVTNLLEKLRIAVASKGFILKENCYSNSEEAHRVAHNRIDLYLSDNNLGDSQSHTDSSKKNDGIDFYLTLRQQKYLCDFVLYTKSPPQEIINKLVSDLSRGQDPNLFSRFTFVSRENGGEDWHLPILSLLDHVLTKREEMNNLRGLYGQRMSKIEAELRIKYPLIQETKLKLFINRIPDLDNRKKTMLHEVRDIRNGLLHNDEEFCTNRNQYVVRFQNDKNETPRIQYEVFEDELQIYRNKLSDACAFVASLP